MGKRFCAIALALAAAALVTLAPAGAFASYRGTLASVTHRGQLYNLETWDAEIVWYATFFDEGFREAFIDKTISVNHMEPAEAERFAAEQERRQALGWDFFVVMYTKKDYRKFTLDSDTIWKAILTTESGEAVKPVEIEAVPVTPYLKVVYPHFNRWSKSYRVTFPKVDLGSKFAVTLESVVGDSTLRWVIQTPEQMYRSGGNKYSR